MSANKYVNRKLMCAIFSFCFVCGYSSFNLVNSNYITAEEIETTEWNDITSGSYKIMNCAYLNMRVEPNIDSDVILVIPRDTIVNVISTNGEWTKYEYDGKIGYSLSEYVVKYSWNGKYDVSWYDAQDSEFHIFTAEELAGIAYLSNESGQKFENQTIYLEADLDLLGADWKPIAASYSSEFKGIFNGQNHTISNLKSVSYSDADFYGLFGVVKGSINNVNLCSCSISGQSYVGGIAGDVKDGTIEKCTVSGTVNGGSWAGGIVGKVDGKSIVTKCKSEVKIENGSNRGSYTGGIAGGVIDESIIEECVSNSEVKNYSGLTYNPYMGYGGGICGLAGGNAIVRNVYNTGNVSSNDESKGVSETIYHSYTDYAGGIVGYLKEKALLENAYNTGVVTAGHCGAVICTYESSVAYANIYYLTGVAAKGTYKGADKAVPKNSTNMKKEEFAISLSDKFVSVPDTFVKLRWELESGINDDLPSINISSMNVGETIKLEVTNYTGSITWISSDTKLLSVDTEGNARALAPGVVKLVAVLESGKALTGDIIIDENNVIKGDLNFDGVLDVSDLLKLQKWFYGLEELTDLQKNLVDLNDDSIINIVDFCLLKKQTVIN